MVVSSDRFTFYDVDITTVRSDPGRADRGKVFQWTGR